MNDTHGSNADSGRYELDLYIDGLLDAERRAAFERRLFADPELAAELERQRSLDERLVAAFSVPEDPAAIVRDALAGGRTRHAGGRVLSFTRFAVAASVLAALGLGLWGLGFFDQVTTNTGVDVTGELAKGAGRGVAEDGMSCGAFGGLYAELAEESRQFVAACVSPQDLGLLCKDKYGQELIVDATDEVPIEGPFACQRGPTTTVLWSPQQPDPILILVDAVANDPKPVLEANSPAHLFRRELGDLVLYEVSPWDTPRTLDLFRLR